MAWFVHCRSEFVLFVFFGDDHGFGGVHVFDAAEGRVEGEKFEKSRKQFFVIESRTMVKICEWLNPKTTFMVNIF